MKNRHRSKPNSEAINALYILAGLFCAAAAYRLYMIPNNIVAGGFTGLSQLINHFTGINVGILNIILNTPLFLVSMKSIGVRFGIRSLIAMGGFSIVMDILPLPAATNDMMLASVYGGLMMGVGFGLVIRGSATTGGTDMLAALINRFIPSLKIGTGIFIINGAVVVASGLAFDLQAAMYAMITIFIANVMIDMVLEGPNSATSFFIISDKSDEIAHKILYDMDRGVTALDGMGMYNGVRKQVLLCVVNRFESAALRKLVFSVDPSAFVIANKANEVLGQGFKPGNIK